MRKALLTLAVVFIITASADSRCLLNTQELTWTSGIGKDCQTVCPTPLVFSTASGPFHPIASNPASYSCRVTLDDGSQAAGFQTVTGECTANANGQAVTSSNYQCGCLASLATQGLDPAVGGSCTSACTNVLGVSGAALTDGIGSVCMPTSEVGNSNHFGSTTSGQCNYVGSDNSATSTNAFSCVCSFAQSALTAG